MYRSPEDLQRAVDEVVDLQTGIVDGRVDPEQGADQIADRMSGIVSSLVVFGIPGPQIYSDFVEPLGAWAGSLFPLAFNDRSGRGPALEACMHKVIAIFDKYKFYENEA